MRKHLEPLTHQPCPRCSHEGSPPPAAVPGRQSLAGRLRDPGRARRAVRCGIGPELRRAARSDTLGGKIPVLVDGGVRRGTDAYKALTLGATAVGIGRPYCWGLAAFGEPGVAAVLSILQREFETIMRQAGATALKQITATTLAAGAEFGL